jgi:integrase
MKLTYSVLINAKPQSKPYKIRDRDAMYLLVSAAGSKTWKFDYRLDGKACTYTLGRFPDVSLGDARRLRGEAAQSVAAGIHPKIRDKKLQREGIDHHANTLWPICEEWLEDNQAVWTPYYHGQATRFVTRYVKDSLLGNMPVRDIKAAHIYDLLQSVAKRKTLGKSERKAEGAPHVALRLRRHLGAVFRRAIISGRADVNPVVALKVSDVLTLPPTRHNRALDASELADVLDGVAAVARPLARLALRLLLLTAVRTSELRGATWKEIDFESRTWSIPGSRMKMRRPHLVPLSDQAVVALKNLQTLTKAKAADDYLFPNIRDKSRPMAASTINGVLAKAGFNDQRLFRAHGARGTFSTWAYENGFTPQAIERQLAHVERNRVIHAYNKAEYLPERRKMMDVWGEHLQKLSH